MELDDDYFDGGIFFEVVELRSGVLIPPCGALHTKKSPHVNANSSKDGGEGGLTRCARPPGSPFAGSRSVQLAAPVVEPRSGVLIPPWQDAIYKERACMLMQALSLKDGGEGGIRTPDTLPYTHFPGVLLQPLGHLTILYCQPTLAGQRGATIGSWLKTVKNNLSIADCSLTQ